MSFGKNQPKPDKGPKPAGIDDERLSSNQEARAVPVFWGQQRLPGFFISKVFGIRTVTKKKSGGKFAPDTTIGTDYYASWAIAFCNGPADALIEIWMDSVRVWVGSVQQVAQDYDDITIDGRGILRLYWGTDTQIADPHLNDATLRHPSGQDHPAYRGTVYAVFKSFYIGRNRTNLPNVELTLRKFPEEYSWISSAEAKVSSDCNVPAAVYDLLVNTRYGLGLPTTRFLDTAGTDNINATLNTLCAEDLACSPVLTSAITARQAVQQMLEYVDAYPVIGADGLLNIKLIRENDPALSPAVAEDDVLEDPKINVGSWQGSRNNTRVTFRDRDRSYRESAASWRDQGTFAITAEPSVQNVQRPWITRQTTARQVAGAIGAASAIPEQTYRLRVHKGAVPAIAIGARIPFSYAPAGLSGLVLRVLEQTIGAPGSEDCELLCRVERGWINSALYGTTDDPDTNGSDSAAASAAQQKVVELPYDLCLPAKGEGLPLASMAALLVRGDEFTNRYTVWKKKSATSAAFAQVATDDAFTIYGTLTADYVAETETIDTLVGFTVNVTSADQLGNLDVLEMEEALSNDTLIFIDNEILSLYMFTLVSGTTYKVFAIRNRYDTARVLHTSGTAVYIVPRGIITPFNHKGIANAKTATYRLLTEIEDSILPIASASDIPVTFTARSRRPLPPANFRKTATYAAVTGQLRTGNYTTGDTIYFRWDLTDPQHDDYWEQWRYLNAKAWSSADDYEHGDDVFDSDQVWIAKQPSGPGNGGAIEPTVTALWFNYWSLKVDYPRAGARVELYTTGLVLKKTFNMGRGVRKLKFTATQINTWFGSLQDVTVRVYGLSGDLLSQNYVTFNLVKV